MDMRLSLVRLFFAGLSVLALGTVGCSSDTSKSGAIDAGKKTDGAADAKADRATSRTDAAVTDAHDGGKSDAGKSDAGKSDGGQRDAGKSDAGNGDGGGLDLGGIAPPTMLTATVLDRRATTFELVWTAPSNSGARVNGYQVRYAKVPITTANFDDATVTAVATYAGTPKAPGNTDGTIVKAYIENGYYFAVSGTDGSGAHVGDFMATSTPVAAHFLITTLSGQATTDHIGLDVSGAGDLGTATSRAFARDGLSDLVVGSAASTKVYLYFGTSSGYSTTPSVTITGSFSGFGQGAIDAGDLDGDGLDDIAISSPNDGVGGKLFIFSRKNPPSSWGTTTSWPAALTDTQANYTITLDATFTGTFPIRPLARLGNFDGTGSDDLAFATRGRGTGGSVLIIKGSSSFASLSLPNAANTIEIDGPAAAGSQFGYIAIGIGDFFPGAGPALVTSAVNSSTLYAYRGQPGVPSAADDVTVGTAGQRYGATLGFLGPIGTSLGALTAQASTGSFVDLFLGTAADGPFLGVPGGAPAPTIHFVDSAAGNSFGVLNVGGRLLGTSQTVSLIGGDLVADLLLAGQSETGSPIYMIDGAQIPTLSATVDVSTAAARQQAENPIIRIPNIVPAAWSGYATGTMIPDSNGDSYGDFAVGEFASTSAGHVVVLY
jgi:FG-GAP-like repeat